MVEASRKVVGTEVQAAAMDQVPTAEKKVEPSYKESHKQFMREFLKNKKQEAVMFFKRSKDAVLSVYAPNSFQGQGCISCTADHNVRSKQLSFSENFVLFVCSYQARKRQAYR